MGKKNPTMFELFPKNCNNAKILDQKVGKMHVCTINYHVDTASALYTILSLLNTMTRTTKLRRHGGRSLYTLLYSATVSAYYTTVYYSVHVISSK